MPVKQNMMVVIEDNKTSVKMASTITKITKNEDEVNVGNIDEVDGPLGDKITDSFMKLTFLKILLLDIGISLGDLVTDLLQAMAFILSSDWSLQHSTSVYGVAVLVFMLLPGVVTLLHFVTHTQYVHSLGWKKSILVVLIELIVFSVIPTVGYLVLLFKKRRFITREEREEYESLETRTREIKTIAGAVESPLQVILLLWLMLRGTVSLPWGESLSFSCIQDQLGNSYNMPKIKCNDIFICRSNSLFPFHSNGFIVLLSGINHQVFL